MAGNDALGRSLYGPQGQRLTRVYEEGYYALLHTKNIKALGIVEKALIMFSFCKSIGAVCGHGNQNSGPNVTFPHHLPQN